MKIKCECGHKMFVETIIYCYKIKCSVCGRVIDIRKVKINEKSKN